MLLTLLMATHSTVLASMSALTMACGTPLSRIYYPPMFIEVKAETLRDDSWRTLLWVKFAPGAFSRSWDIFVYPPLLYLRLDSPSFRDASDCRLFYVPCEISTKVYSSSKIACFWACNSCFSYSDVNRSASNRFLRMMFSLLNLWLTSLSSSACYSKDALSLIRSPGASPGLNLLSNSCLSTRSCLLASATCN